MITVKRQSEGPRAIKFSTRDWESGDLFVGAAAQRGPALGFEAHGWRLELAMIGARRAALA